MLKGCDLYVNGAPRPMCMSAIYWAHRLRVFRHASFSDTSKTGFDDEFQYIDFKLPWEEQKAIKCYPDFKQEDALRACEARQNKKDRHPYLIPAG
jgi:guanine deaminase